MDERRRDFKDRKKHSKEHLRGVREVETREKSGKSIQKEIKDETFSIKRKSSCN